MSRQVRDPERDEDWQIVEVHNDREAVLLFLRDYDPADIDTGMPFVLHVRDDDDDEPREVKVRVVPVVARFDEKWLVLQRS